MIALDRRVHIVQGDCRISADPDLMFTTTLGSCVAACLHDPQARIGGMNHFLLPGGEGETSATSIRYGAYAMELLVNQLLKAGARRERLTAKLFGGGRVTDSSVDVGAKNAAFAAAFLEREGIAQEPGSVGGRQARRIQFWPAIGRVRQMTLSRASDAIPQRPGAARPAHGHGDLELF